MSARGVLLFGLLTLAGWAEPVSITVLTEPPQARLTDQYGAYLGLSGEPFTVDPSKYGSQLELVAERDGYERAVFGLKTPELQPGARLPRTAVRLTPQASVARWVSTSLLPALGLLGGGGLLGVILLGRKAKVREQQRREQVLSEVDPSDTLATQKLGTWRLLQKIGRGGMATVYRAVPAASLNEAEAVAVKVIRSDIATDDEFLQRFRREARVTKALNHPHIVRMVDWGEEEGLAYMAMELLTGGTLRERLQRQAVVPAEAWTALEGICDALAYAHGQGVVHRDLKPENLMVTGSGLLKVTDFGLARVGSMERITATGAVMGTPTYMAPEQIHGEPPHPAMDQYAVGVMAYELLTGRLPFSDPDPVRQLFMTLTEDPRPPSAHQPLSPAVDAAVLRMLAKAPEGRFPDIEAAAAALEAALAR